MKYGSNRNNECSEIRFKQLFSIGGIFTSAAESQSKHIFRESHNKIIS